MSKMLKFEVLHGSTGAFICRIEAQKVKVNTRTDMYEFYIGAQIVAWVPQFSTIVRRAA